MNEEYKKIRAKAILELPLTKKERAIYLLFIATTEEMHEFLDKEKGDKRNEKI